jgi:ketosteroid isomerase-like protein
VSRDPEEIIRAHYAAFNARDPQALLDTCAADVLIDDHLRVDAGLYHGREEVRNYFEGLWEVSSTAEVEPVELRYHEDRVWVRAKVWAQGRASGVEAGMTFAHVFTIVGGRISRIEVYADPAEALKAVGLSE